MLLLDGAVPATVAIEPFDGPNAAPNDGADEQKTDAELFELLLEADPPEENSCFDSSHMKEKSA